MSSLERAFTKRSPVVIKYYVIIGKNLINQSANGIKDMKLGIAISNLLYLMKKNVGYHSCYSEARL